MSKQLVTIKEAGDWASVFLKRDVTESNISYLIQYGKVEKYNGNGNIVQVNLEDLKSYYESFHGKRELNWKEKLGNDLNWSLSFDHLRERDTTKHVHRLHPYKGKFIPQLVEYFIDDHIDDFKTEVYFKKDDIILDPFAGSGTMLVQANELGMHSIGIDVSHFNCMISDTKLIDYDISSLSNDINTIKGKISEFETGNNIIEFEKELFCELAKFNNRYFPSPTYKRQVYQRKINETSYSRSKEKEFLEVYNKLIRKYQVKLEQNESKNFLDKWYVQTIRREIDFAFEHIKKNSNEMNKRALAVILSRTIRSCRATTHSDLATLKEPQITTYYCWKHKKICKPLFSIKYFNNFSLGFNFFLFTIILWYFYHI